METNETPNPETRKRRSWRGESATEASGDAATASTEASDAVEPAPAAEAPPTPTPEPALTERQAWKRRRAIALGLIRP